MKTYNVIRIVEESYQVQAKSKKEAIALSYRYGDPYDVEVIRESAELVKDKKESNP